MPMNLDLRGYLRETMGRDPKMQKVYETVEAVVQTDCTISIRGESGTGKELIARAIHHYSPRKDKPFVVANCSAYSKGLMESELFGYEKGAFTGAIRAKSGRFELAHQGTIFLDEIGDIPPSTQLLLLRVLQEMCFERVGGEKTIHVDVRVIAATNKNLEELMKIGKFRKDLYYRLNVISVHIPPLRERKKDIPLLSENFLKRFAKGYGKDIKRFSPEALELMMGYDWPGNVRELENVTERGIILAKGDTITVDNLPRKVQNPVLTKANSEDSLLANERRHILEVLQKTNWNKQLASQKLEISRSTLHSKIKKYGLERFYYT